MIFVIRRDEINCGEPAMNTDRIEIIATALAVSLRRKQEVTGEVCGAEQCVSVYKNEKAHVDKRVDCSIVELARPVK